MPHTHWDREWPLPFRDTQLRLARVLDEVLDVLERDPRFTSFTLDGQSAALEDYLEVRPGQASRLRRAIVDGRLLVGPSYVIPDEYLASGEALVRNLLLGDRAVEALGGRPMPVAYLPDSFGHVAQLPQILRGFGLHAFVFWRGLGDEAERLGAVFAWEAPDGSEVLAIRQVGGYGSCAELGRWGHLDHFGNLSEPLHDQPERWAAAAVEWMDAYIETFRDEFDVAGLRDVLLGNGYDHTSIQADLPDMLEVVAGEHPGARFAITSLPDYVDLLRAWATRLPRHDGELCGGRYASVFRSVNSTRGWLKRANEAADRALCLAETVTSLAQLRAWSEGPAGDAPSVPGFRDELRLAWRELLRNLSHDSISGSSVDEVESDMAQRSATVQRIAARLTREGLARLASEEATWTYEKRLAVEWESAPDAGRKVRLSVLNALPFERRGPVEVPLPPGLSRAASVAAVAGEEALAVQLAGAGASRRALIDLALPAWGTRTVRLATWSDTAAPASHGDARAVDERTIENPVYRVRAEPDGTFTITDRRDGSVHRGHHRFEDVADRGDLYTFCPLADEVPGDGLAPPGQVQVRVLARGPLVAELEVAFALRLPRRLRSDRRARLAATLACPVRTVVRLAASADRIAFRTRVLNRARDHRLRVRFPSPRPIEEVRAEGHFAVIRRPPEPQWRGHDWRETPARTHHSGGAVEGGGLLLLTRGLPEYEVVRRGDGGSDLAVTLLRCVDAISRADLDVRPGHVGPAYPTPGAQGLGRHDFEYAIALGGEGLDDAALLRASQDFRLGFLIGPAEVEMPSALLPTLHGLLVSALKPAEDGDGVILRAFAPTDGTGGSLRWDPRSMEVTACRLDESALPKGQGPSMGRHAVPPGSIATLRLRPRSPGGAVG